MKWAQYTIQHCLYRLHTHVFPRHNILLGAPSKSPGMQCTITDARWRYKNTFSLRNSHNIGYRKVGLLWPSGATLTRAGENVVDVHYSEHVWATASIYFLYYDMSQGPRKWHGPWCLSTDTLSINLFVRRFRLLKTSSHEEIYDMCIFRLKHQGPCPFWGLWVMAEYKKINWGCNSYMLRVMNINNIFPGPSQSSTRWPK